MLLQPLQQHYSLLNSLISKIHFYFLHLLLPLSLLWLHAPFTSTFASSSSASTFDRFPLLHSPLRNHTPPPSPQASFCHLCNNTAQIIIYSHIPQTTRSIPVSEQKKSHFKIYFYSHISQAS